jgi:hypothetical protein
MRFVTLENTGIRFIHDLKGESLQGSQGVGQKLFRLKF